MRAGKVRRGCAAGPLTTVPPVVNREPWHGQSRVCPGAAGSRIVQPSCVQVRDTVTTVVLLSRVIANCRSPDEAATVCPTSGNGSRSTVGSGGGGVNGDVVDPPPPQRAAASAVQAAPSRHTNSRRPDFRSLSIRFFTGQQEGDRFFDSPSGAIRV